MTLDTSSAVGYPDLVTAKDLRRILRSFGCVESRQRGSHLRVECGQCVTTVPVHAGEDIGPGLLRRIERDLAPCLGKGWLKKP
jgi:predicted RNA binding protein YcfA (HicA-like mRNA interferase family)